jgi:hypothetical protein
MGKNELVRKNRPYTLTIRSRLFITLWASSEYRHTLNGPRRLVEFGGPVSGMF